MREVIYLILYHGPSLQTSNVGPLLMRNIPNDISLTHQFLPNPINTSNP